MRIAAAFLLLVITLATPAYSITLNGSVEKTDAEGRIGIRVSTSGLISKVHAGSPADQAGLRENDTVVAVDGRRRAIRQIHGEPGTTVQLECRRGFERFAVAVERIDVRQIYY